MITRQLQAELAAALDRQAAVAILGPRQSGKTTLALELGSHTDSIYLDLEDRRDRAKLEDPVAYLESHAEKLVILDEIHRTPDLFDSLRGIIDRGRRTGNRTGRFLLLGSASMDLLRQSETLAGRIEYIELGPLLATEACSTAEQQARLWLRGGFPDSFLAQSDEVSMRLRRSFLRTYLERDVPMFGPRIPSETLERLWIMLAHAQGGILNASRLASGLGVSSPTITNYVGLLVDLLLVRRLAPIHKNVGKRLVKSPKVYVRDSGLTHALLGIESADELLSHPVSGPSWEGFVIENLIMSAPFGTRAGYWRTQAGAEIDLVLELGGKAGTWAIEVKRSASVSLGRGFHSAQHDLTPQRSFLVHAGENRYAIKEGVEVIGLRELCAELRALASGPA
jgi:uncharacterized protein